MNKQLRHFLKQHHIHFDVFNCKPGWSLEAFAAKTRLPTHGIAKTTLVRVDGKLAMLIEPALLSTDLEKWKTTLGANKIELLSDSELEDLFREHEKNQISPFDELYEVDMDVFLDDALSKEKELVLSAGDSDFIKIPYSEYVETVKPKLFHIH